jgi:hypothetical protein
MTVIGWDIGGANLKASDGEGVSLSRPFPLWQSPEELAGAVRAMRAALPAGAAWAVTMTGELADCFDAKAEGVERILRSLAEAADGLPVHVWTTTGEFVSCAEACAWPRLAAAANWHALATWCGRMAPQGAALLIDIGSTTTDLIPLLNGFPDPVGRTDLERLLSGELVYTGVRRTPVNTLAAEAPWRGGRCPLAAESFATMLDVYLLTGEIPPDPGDLNTADGRPATREHAVDRLARMVCCDREECTHEDAYAMARELAERQQQRMAAALERVVARLPVPVNAVLLAGEGGWLGASVLQRLGGSLAGATRLELDVLLGREHSRAACAFALARLGRERLGWD